MTPHSFPRTRLLRRSGPHARPRRRLFLEPLEDRRVLAAFVVNSVDSVGDSYFEDGICDTENNPLTDPPTPPSGICTLRAAGDQATFSGGSHEISFDIPGGGVPVIDTNAFFGGATVEIDGTSQPGGFVEIQGTVFFSDSSGNTVKGLVLNAGGLQFFNSSDNTVIGSRFGVTADGSAKGDGSAGVEFHGNNNRFGGVDPADRNIIAGDILIRGNHNKIHGNYFGVDITGEVPIVGGRIGVQIDLGSDNEIGGTTPEHGNVFASTDHNGSIRLQGMDDENVPKQTIIRNNFIGTNKDGTVALGNFGAGVVLVNTTDNLIRDNVISAGRIGIGGVNPGILIADLAHRNQIQGNRIGTDATGTTTDPDGVPNTGDEFGNTGAGISFNGGGAALGAFGNRIGGTTLEDANVLSGNLFGVILFNAVTDNTVEGNFIGTDITGTVALPNGKGVEVQHASRNVIGGVRPNVISGNTGPGVVISGSTGTDNLVANNRIGTNLAGTADLPNEIGILINDSPANCIGGVLPAGPESPVLCNAVPSAETTLHGNVISGNEKFGIQVVNPNARLNRFQGNLIGTDATGMAAIANGFDGVAIMDSADENLIGGNQPIHRNVISGNTGDGVLVIGRAGNLSSGNRISGNYIGVDITGETALKNHARGVHIDGFVEQTVIGGNTANERNIISGNGLDGIIVAFATTSQNTIKNNFIGTDKDGETAVANERNGIRLLNTPNNKIGEVLDTSGLGNVISGNLLAGVRIEGSDSTGNVLVNNVIGLNADRDAKIPNQEDGIRLVDAPQNVIGGSFAGSPTMSTFVGNVISGNTGAGIQIEGAAHKNWIGANLIGMDGSGRQPIGNLDHGIHIVDAAQTRIGFSLPIAGEPELSGNTISRNLDGIYLDGASVMETIIGGNQIGTDWEGNLSDPPDFFGNTLNGIRIRQGSENFVGGLVFHSEGQATQLPGNKIVGNRIGVRVDGESGVFNKIQRNSIFSNDRLGIDLNGDGSTPNDDGLDEDSGPNQLQNFPIIEEFTSFDSMLRGTFRSEADSEYTFDLYKSREADEEGLAEGEIWLGAFTVTTDENGVAEFEIPVTLDPAFKWLTLTATDGAGNTSEFSAPLRQADLAIDAFSIFPVQVVKNAQGFVLPFQITVRNLGTATAQNALVRITGNDQVLDATDDVTLEPGESQTLSGEWNLNALLQANPRGVASLELNAFADPNNVISELPGGVNQREATMTADARPVITAVLKEFAEGAFLQNVPLNNTVEVFVDWNGNLDNVALTEADLPRVLFQINGIETLPDGGMTSLTSGEPTRFTFGMHDDLNVGANEIRIWAQNRLQNFESDPKSIRYDQYATIDWIEAPLWVVKANGGPHEKIAEYKAKIFFPQTATAGFFNVPVDRVGISGGDFGPDIPQAAITTTLRSDRTSRIEGELKVEGEVADKDLGGPVSSLVATAAGELAFAEELDLKKLEAKLRGEVSIKSPKVPLPPAPWIRAQATFGLAVDGLLEWEEDEQGELQWKSDLILGLEPSGEFALSVGHRGVTVEVAGGGKLRGEFSLAQNPCLLVGGSASLFVKLKAKVWIFEASKTIPVAQTTLPQCGFGAEGENLPIDVARLADHIGLIPRSQAGFPPATGEDPADLPLIDYAYAKPALARHSDGTMTLVYVSEDPTKPTGQQLEIFASHYDGATWSAPVAISDDTFLDDAPSVVYDDNGNAIAVWSRIATTVADPANTDPHTLLEHLEIVYSVRDQATGTWSEPAQLTDNTALDHLPKIARGANGEILVVWLHDADSDSPLFPDDDTRTLGADYHYSAWNGTSWTEPAVAVTGVKTNAPPQIAVGDGEAILVWSEDGDGDVTTDVDSEVRAVRWDGDTWAAPVSLAAADGHADVTPRVAFNAQGAAVVWVKTGVPLAGDEGDFVDQVWAVEYAAGVFGPAELQQEAENITEPHFLFDGRGNGILLWLGLSDAGPDIFVAVRDAVTGQISEPVAMTNSPQLEWSLNPYLDGEDELQILYLERELGSEDVPLGNGEGSEGEETETITIPTFLSSRLGTAAISLSADLTVDSITLGAVNPTLGGEVDVVAVVRNAGLEMIAASTVVLLDDGNLVAGPLDVPALAAGASATVTFRWLVPTESAAPRTLLVRVDPQDDLVEANEQNNDRTLIALQPDLVVKDVTAVTAADSIVLTAVVMNQGGSPTLVPTTVALRQNDPGAENDLATESIAAGLAPGATTTVSFTIANPATTLKQSVTGYVVVDATGAVAESDELNNFAFGGLHPFLSWQNPVDRFDVSNDSFVVPNDVLIVINRINAFGAGLLPVPATPPFFYDVNGDGFATPNDVLQIINLLNNEGEDTEAEGEGETQPVVSWVASSGESFVLQLPTVAADDSSATPPTSPHPRSESTPTAIPWFEDGADVESEDERDESTWSAAEDESWLDDLAEDLAARLAAR